MPVPKNKPNKPITFYAVSTDTDLALPLAGSKISAGFPSPADDFLEGTIDLNKHLIKNESSTFFARINGDSMKNIGIGNNDLIIVDKSLKPQNGNIAVCDIDGEHLIKRIKIEKNCIWLIAENEDYPPIKVTAENKFIIWGIVRHVIKSFV